MRLTNSMSEQLSLETWTLETRADRLEESLSSRGVFALGGASDLFGGELTALTETIRAWCKAESIKRGQKHVIYKMLQSLKYDEVAGIVVKTVITKVSGKDMAGLSRQALAASIANALQSHVSYSVLVQKDEKLAQKLAFAAKAAAVPQRSRIEIEIRKAAQRLVLKDCGDTLGALLGVSSSPAETKHYLLQVGHALLALYATTSTLFTEQYRGHKDVILVKPADSFRSFVQKLATEQFARATIARLPMVVEPLPWDGVEGGGYLLPTSRYSLIQARSANAQQQLNAQEMPAFYNSINALQGTKWSVNRSIAYVYLQLLRQDEGVAGLPVRLTKRAVVPYLPWTGTGMDHAEIEAYKEAHPEEMQALNKLRREARATNEKNLASMALEHQRLGVLNIMRKFDHFYFPYFADFRGRIYAAATVGILSPQGDDISKALLRFAEGKPIGEEGALWLGRHVCGTWGNDKTTQMNKDLWVEFNRDWLVACARDPLKNREWMKADKPFQFLAAIIEYAGYLAEGPGFVSHLPISQDGSCSGLQHYAAMLRDAKMAASVNVSPSEEPQDIYSVVLDACHALAKGDTQSFKEEALSRLIRKTIKQPVMTTAYGVSDGGVRKQLRVNIKKLVDKGVMKDFKDKEDSAQCIGYLTSLIARAKGTELTAAMDAMAWMGKVCEEAIDTDTPISWVTPVGFKVIPDYKKAGTNKITFTCNGLKQEMLVQKGTSQIDRKAHVQSIAPNFLHSLDAAALQLTVDSMRAKGFKAFAMIHDDFAVHACDTELLNKVLREEFVNLYQEDVLQNLADGLKVPLLAPKRGTLDLEGVKDSRYFFA